MAPSQEELRAKGVIGGMPSRHLRRSQRAPALPHRLVARSLLALGAVAALSAALSPAASALGAYEVQICTQAADQISIVNNDGTRQLRGLDTTKACGTGGVGTITHRGLGGTFPEPMRGKQSLTITAPADTTLATLRFDLAFGGMWDISGLEWTLRDDRGNVDLRASAELATPLPAQGSYDRQFPNGTKTLTTSLECPRLNEGCFGGGGDPSRTAASVTLTSLSSILIDDLPPTDVGLRDALPATVRGVQRVLLRANDKGAGIVNAHLIIDRVPQAFVNDPNGGKCAVPYRDLVPCPTSFEQPFDLDTTKLADGEHTLVVAANDAAGGQTKTAPLTFFVQNGPATPQGPQPPAGPGSPGPGSPGPGSPGPTAPGGPGATPDRTAPVLSGVSLSRARFRIGKTATAITAAKKAKRPVAGGTTLRFTSSEAATLSLVIERAKPGRTVKSKGKTVCKAVKRAVKRGRCTLYAGAQTLTRTIAAGPGTVALSGRIGTKRMAPGSYRITLIARDAAGNASAQAQRTFTVLRG